MNIDLKTKQKIYLYIEKEHGWISTRLLLLAISGLLFLLRTPQSLNQIIRQEVYAGDFKTPVRRVNWLLIYAKNYKQLFDDNFFDFSLGLDHGAAADMLELLSSKSQPKQFADHLHLAQLASRAIESCLAPGQAISLEGHSTQYQFDLRYTQEVTLALEALTIVFANTLPISKALDESKAGFKSSESFSKNTLAQEVFCDVIDFMRQHQAKVYSISGTLLGIIREKKLLSHDVDIDLGIMEEHINVESLLKAIRASDNFYLKKVDYPVLRTHSAEGVIYSRMSIPSLIKFGHKKGLHIDLFIHFKDGQLRWHGSSLHRWNNAEFEVVTTEIFGKNVSIPSPADRYLEENYGDWKTPKLDFNCSVDTPNIALQNSCKTICYFVKLLHFYRSDSALSMRILTMLEQQDIAIPEGLRLAVAKCP